MTGKVTLKILQEKLTFQEDADILLKSDHMQPFYFPYTQSWTHNGDHTL